MGQTQTKTTHTKPQQKTPNKHPTHPEEEEHKTISPFVNKKRKKLKLEHELDYELDLSKYGLDGNSDEFIIMSEFLADEHFMRGLKAKKYQEKMKTYKCSTCLKIFKFVSEIKRHTKVHSEERSFQCQHCSSSFKVRHSLLLHQTNKFISVVTLPHRAPGQRVCRPPLSRHPSGGRGLLQLCWPNTPSGQNARTDETRQTGGG